MTTIARPIVGPQPVHNAVIPSSPIILFHASNTLFMSFETFEKYDKISKTSKIGG